jgi:hypothetical protein
MFISFKDDSFLLGGFLTPLPFGSHSSSLSSDDATSAGLFTA